MILIIAGSRDYNLDLSTIQNFIDILIPVDQDIDEIVSGRCKGVDKSGENYAEFQNIPLKKFTADWDAHGNAAGPIRNREMAKYADALLLIWNGKSKGSSNMKNEMLKLGKPVYEVTFKTIEKDEWT
jgi:hypothetical protein